MASADAERIDREERCEEPGFFKRQGKYAAEAETIYCTVLGVMKRVLGAEHSITLLTANNLATFLAHQDEPAKPSGRQPRFKLCSCQRKLCR